MQGFKAFYSNTVFASNVLFLYLRFICDVQGSTSKMWSLTEPPDLRKLFLVHFRAFKKLKTIFVNMVLILSYFFLLPVPYLFSSSLCLVCHLVSLFVFVCLDVCVFGRMFVSLSVCFSLAVYGQFVLVVFNLHRFRTQLTLLKFSFCRLRHQTAPD